MAAGKWIGGALGFIVGGPLGGLVGFVIGSMFDSAGSGYIEQGSAGTQDYGRQSREGERNSFLFSLLVLAAYMIKADGRVMHSEMETVRRWLRINFGEQAVGQGEQIMRRLFEKEDQMGRAQYRQVIGQCCAQIAVNMNYSQRLQLLSFLAEIAKADQRVDQVEIDALREIAVGLGLSAADADSMLNLSRGGSDLEAAYRVLGISPSATNAEVKDAYRKMALKHHPDRVATLGEDVRRAAEKKFQEINAAKETIYKARGL